MSARTLAPEGSRLAGSAPCRHRATSRARATPPRAAAENPKVSAALGASSRVRDFLPAAAPEAERPAAAQPPTASAAAREAAEWQEWQHTFHEYDAQDRLCDALRVRASGARAHAHAERVHAFVRRSPARGPSPTLVLKPLSCALLYAQAQLDTAVAAEDYVVASRLADALRVLQDEDAVGGLMRDLGSAIAEERCVCPRRAAQRAAARLALTAPAPAAQIRRRGRAARRGRRPGGLVARRV